ncbi:hypothetical protein Pmani_026973 [Petrolisthes manimaculis]|uniref:Transmembrane protein n=1 Tax=Petrolisthes manimaculis TaxID=1843537 RepID=A0AAE1P350_9EUCA|nr:hypothetical protein Pmani_026973 [Petrolisthes manimaculis]
MERRRVGCDCLSYKIVVTVLGVVCLLVGVLLVTSSLAFKYHNRWKDCRECLLLLRELDKELTERNHRSLRLPSTLAPPPPLPDPSSFKKRCYSSSKAPPTSTIITNTSNINPNNTLTSKTTNMNTLSYPYYPSFTPRYLRQEYSPLPLPRRLHLHHHHLQTHEHTNI